MGLDIRWPIGFMFTFIGVLLLITGLTDGTPPRSVGINIDLWWGVLLLIFGGGMLLGAMNGRNKGRRSNEMLKR